MPNYPASLTTTGEVRALLYARSAREDHSLPKSIVNGQLTELRTFIQAQGWVNQGEYVDPGISGLESDRPGLTGLLEECRSNQIHVVVVTEVSRLARDLALSVDLLKRLKAMGIRVVETRTEPATGKGEPSCG